MLTVYLLFALGFALLVKGADWLIDGSVSLARRLHISEMIVGLTVVAFGTSAPELTVNVVSAIRGTGGITIGNIIGSNIANIALILGATGLLATLPIKGSLLKKEIPFSLLGAVLIFALSTGAWSGSATLTMGRIGGAVLIASFAFFLHWIWREIRAGHTAEVEELDESHHSISKALLLTGVGLALLIVGGKLVVDNAVAIATSFGISESLIGLTLVAIGTSLPELAASITAALKGKTDLAVGNVVGSNVFNIFWVLGLSAVIRPIEFERTVTTDLLVLGGFTLLLAGLPFLNHQRALTRWHAALFLVGYAGYIWFIVQRG
jgi:cation:H+ antiporter